MESLAVNIIETKGINLIASKIYDLIDKIYSKNFDIALKEVNMEADIKFIEAFIEDMIKGGMIERNQLKSVFVEGELSDNDMKDDENENNTTAIIVAINNIIDIITDIKLQYVKLHEYINNSYFSPTSIIEELKILKKLLNERTHLLLSAMHSYF